MSRPYDLGSMDDVRLTELHTMRPDLQRAIEAEWQDRQAANDYLREHEQEQRTVTREMAIDAGDRSLEGTLY